MNIENAKHPDVRADHDETQGGEDPVLAALQPGELRSRQLEALISQLGFRVSDLARAGSVSTQSIRNWRADANGVGLPEHLDDIRAIAEFLIDTTDATPAQVGVWFQQRNRALDHRRPLDLLCAGEFDQVLRASTERAGVLVPA